MVVAGVPAATCRFAICRLTICLTALGCCSCSLFGDTPGLSREQALAAPATDFAPNAVTIGVQAQARLNPSEGQAHTVVVGVLQAAGLDVLRALAQEPQRVDEALAGGVLPSGILQLVRFVVQPGQTCTMQLDRVQQARAVGLAVGYAQPDAGTALRVFAIPLLLHAQGWLSPRYTAATGPLHLRLRLGARQVLEAGVTQASLHRHAGPAASAPGAPPPPAALPCRRMPAD